MPYKPSKPTQKSTVRKPKVQRNYTNGAHVSTTIKRSKRSGSSTVTKPKRKSDAYEVTVNKSSKRGKRTVKTSTTSVLTPMPRGRSDVDAKIVKVSGIPKRRQSTHTYWEPEGRLPLSAYRSRSANKPKAKSKAQPRSRKSPGWRRGKGTM